MEHRHSGHLSAETEATRRLGTADLDRLTVASRYGLNHLVEVGEDGSDEPAGPRANEDALGGTLDLALAPFGPQVSGSPDRPVRG